MSIAGFPLYKGGGLYSHVTAKNVVHISEAEAASDFAALMARLSAGVEVIIERGKRLVAVLHAKFRSPQVVSAWDREARVFVTGAGSLSSACARTAFGCFQIYWLQELR